MPVGAALAFNAIPQPVWSPRGLVLRRPGADGRADSAMRPPSTRIDHVVEIGGRDDWPQAHLLAVQDNSYDYVSADNVLQHVEQPDEALANWVRVLKPGGLLALVAPDGQSTREDAWRLSLQEPDQPKGCLNLLELLQVVCHLVEIERVERFSHGGPITGRRHVEVLLRKRLIALTPVQSNRAPEMKALTRLTETAVEQRGRWRPMDEFHDVLGTGVLEATVVDLSRLYLLYQWLGTTLHLEGDCAEVGCYRGGTAKLTSEVLLRHRPEVGLHLFDTFEGMPEQFSLDEVGMRGAFADTSLGKVKLLLHNNPAVQFYPGIFPATVPAGFESKRFRFVHIDVDIETSVTDCLTFFYPRMVPGGVIIVDDYGHPNCPGATRAVERFFRNDPHRVVHMPLRSSAVIVKSNGG
jgi:hypothetical protein